MLINKFEMNFFNVFEQIYSLVAVVRGARIFAITPMFGQSHWNVMDAVLQNTCVRWP